VLSTAARVSRSSRSLSAGRVARRPTNLGRVGAMHEPRRRCQQSALDPRTGPHPPLLFAPGKLVDALCYVDVEPRICRGRALDQALNALGVLLALGEHRLGAADGKVVYERSSRSLRLNERRHSVQRLCQRSILRDGYAGKSCRHRSIVAPRCNTSIVPPTRSFNASAGGAHTRVRISGEMELAGLNANRFALMAGGRIALCEDE
jgi:hypothetical protein